jgi:hypothetical protein
MLWTAPLPGASTIRSVADEVTIDTEELDMQAVTTVGFDIAKSIFQIHGVNAQGQVVIRQQLRCSRVLGFFKTGSIERSVPDNTSMSDYGPELTYCSYVANFRY